MFNIISRIFQRSLSCKTKFNIKAKHYEIVSRSALKLERESNTFWLLDSKQVFLVGDPIPTIYYQYLKRGYSIIPIDSDFKQGNGIKYSIISEGTKIYLQPHSNYYQYKFLIPRFKHPNYLNHPGKSKMIAIPKSKLRNPEKECENMSEMSSEIIKFEDKDWLSCSLLLVYLTFYGDILYKQEGGKIILGDDQRDSLLYNTDVKILKDDNEAYTAPRNIGDSITMIRCLSKSRAMLKLTNIDGNNFLLVKFSDMRRVEEKYPRRSFPPYLGYICRNYSKQSFDPFSKMVKLAVEVIESSGELIDYKISDSKMKSIPSPVLSSVLMKRYESNSSSGASDGDTEESFDTDSDLDDDIN